MSEPPARPELRVLMRENCPLCDHVVLALELLRPRFDFVYSKLDVDTDPDLVRRFGTRVPVVLAGERELCAGHCDPAVLERYLSGR